MGCGSLMILSLPCPYNLHCLGWETTTIATVRNQTEDGAQTEFRKYKVKGKML